MTNKSRASATGRNVVYFSSVQSRLAADAEIIIYLRANHVQDVIVVVV
jgi:hypothetical protein